MYILISIGPLAGVLGTIVTPDKCDERTVLSIFITIFSYLSGIIATVIKFSKFEQKATSHKAVAAKYASLEGNIRRQLSLLRKDRVNAGQYLQWVSISFDEVFTSSPLMSEKIYKRWVTFAEKNNITVPKEIGDSVEVDDDENIREICNVQNIIINTDDEPNRERAASAPNTNDDNTFEVIIQGTNTMRRERKIRQRRDDYNADPDFGRFNDGQMRYEMARMYGLSQYTKE